MPYRHSRLCDEVKPGQILISPRVLMAVEDAVTCRWASSRSRVSGVPWRHTTRRFAHDSAEPYGVCLNRCSRSASAADVMRTKTVGTYRVELHLLPAEPFFSKKDVATKHPKEGMEVEEEPRRSCWMGLRILIIISLCTSSILRPAKRSPTRR